MRSTPAELAEHDAVGPHRDPLAVHEDSVAVEDDKIEPLHASHSHGRRWTKAVFAVALYGVFAGWWALLMLVFGLGRCGEDSDIDTTEEFDRLCGDPTSGTFDGVIFTNLAIIGLAATAATVVFAAAALWRRAWWPLALLAIALAAAAALGWNADRL